MSVSPLHSCRRAHSPCACIRILCVQVCMSVVGVCMCAYMPAHIVHVFECTYAHLVRTCVFYVHTCVCALHAHKYTTSTHPCACVCMSTCVFCAHTRVFVYTYMCMYVCKHRCVCVWLCVYLDHGLSSHCPRRRRSVCHEASPRLCPPAPPLPTAAERPRLQVWV